MIQSWPRRINQTQDPSPFQKHRVSSQDLAKDGPP